MKRPNITFLLLAMAVLAAPAVAGGPDSVEICHIPPGNPDNAGMIFIGENAIDFHLAHGDILHCDCLPDAEIFAESVDGILRTFDKAGFDLLFTGVDVTGLGFLSLGSRSNVRVSALWDWSFIDPDTMCTNEVFTSPEVFETDAPIPGPYTYEATVTISECHPDADPSAHINGTITAVMSQVCLGVVADNLTSIRSYHFSFEFDAGDNTYNDTAGTGLFDMEVDYGLSAGFKGETVSVFFP